MAYVSQDLKSKLAPSIKAVCKKYGIKASLAVRNNSTLVLNVSEGPLDFGDEDYIQVNPYHYKSHYQGKALKFLSEVIPLMNRGNHDNSDIMTDYFDVGWYVDVNIGRWNKPYRRVA